MQFVTRPGVSLREVSQSSTCSSKQLPTLPSSRFGIFASIAGGVFGASATSEPVTEKHTGTVFSGEFCYLKKHDCPRITGTGVRAKRLLGIKNVDVYAIALYVDARKAKATMGGKFRGEAAEDLSKSQRLFDELVASEGVEKTVKLVITSGLVKRKNFLDALAERLEPPMKKAGDMASLDRFKHLFDGVDFRTGLPVSFTSTSKGLVTQVDGKEVGVIPSRQFVRAFFEMYVGRDPVSPGAKESFGKGLATMVLE